MIGAAHITITSELAQAIGDVARDYPSTTITIAWDYRDKRPENEWTITVENGPGVPTPVVFLLDDENAQSYAEIYGEAA